MSQGTQQMTMTHEEARFSGLREKHPLPWTLTKSPLKIGPTIRDANDNTVEEIPFDFLVWCVNAAFTQTAQTARVPTREEISDVIHRKAIISDEYGVDDYVTNADQLADAILALLHTPDATGGV